ncbi:hypothetical protein GCM10009819_11610 [Agromyces tropicus]|uniref:DUF998 domain-containing protein n=2 Tax=Agromyces tropicus TaxID=555371 RepID=A0ABP5FM12_9MICO
MLVIAVAVAVAVANLLVHTVHEAHHTVGDAAHPLVDVLCVVVAVASALLSLTALTLASIGGGRGAGGRCRVSWASPELGALANAAVWASIAALAVASSADAFAPLPGGHVTACAVFAGGLGALTGSVHRRAHGQPVYRSFNLVAMLLAAGSLASMSLTDTGEWWASNFSTLGTSDDVAAVWFNAALVLSGGAMAAMSRPLARGLARPEYRPRRGATVVVRILIATIGLALAGVGLVPIDADEVIHNVFASTAGASFFALAAGTPRLVRRMPRALVATSIASLSAEVLTWVVYDRLGWASLTVFEMVAFALVFVWLITLVLTTHPERGDPAAVASPAGAGRTASPGAAAARVIPAPVGPRPGVPLAERMRTGAIAAIALGDPARGMPTRLARST